MSFEAVIKCPQCAREVQTGFCYDSQQTWEACQCYSNFVHCGGCRALLQWDKADAVLKPSEKLFRSEVL